jgi:rubrerythrin
MKKTYFLNSKEICDIATNWDSYLEKYQISIENKRTAAQLQQELEQRKLNFLKENAKSVSRQENVSMFFYETDREMNGKYGWFSSYGKSYNMTEYKSGWAFESEEKYHEFLNIK